MSTNFTVQDLDLPRPVDDGRRLEVVVDGLSFWGNVQRAVNTTLASVLHTNGMVKPGPANGAALVSKRRSNPTLGS